VKAAASELHVTESAVSMHIRTLRDELDDRLFVRAGGRIAFTPGGLRLASRANELLGLQDQTRREVRQAAGGKRLLRLAGSALFAEYAAPGLIELFSSKANDLEVELSVVPTSQLAEVVMARQVDLAVGPELPVVDLDIERRPFLRYDLIVVASRKVADRQQDLATCEWSLGPAAAESAGVTPTMLAALGVPESKQRIFQSNAAALEQVRAGEGVGLAVGFRVAQDIEEGRLVRIDTSGIAANGTWNLYSLKGPQLPPAARELTRFITRPRATQAMLSGTGAGIAHFKPRVHVTLWS
jgi:DNA-binding transcriptional LysR family regulator